jgi:hypothetical protein
MFVFSGFRKSDLIKSCSSFEYVRAYKIPLYHDDLCNVKKKEGDAPDSTETQEIKLQVILSNILNK